MLLRRNQPRLEKFSDDGYMGKNDSHQITEFLAELNLGNEMAFDDLIPLVYDELRKMAKRCMNRQQIGHTMQTTELIHEAYLKLAEKKEKDWVNRSHFFGVAAKAMRHILVDYARGKQSEKRGGSPQRVTLDENAIVSNNSASELIAVHEALKKLGELDQRKVNVVEMKFFGGLTMEEIADVLKISPETAKRDWKFSRTWLLRELSTN